MLRSIAIAAFLTIVAACNTAAAQTADSWDAWIADTTPKVDTKDVGIKNMTRNRDHSCPFELGKKKTACTMLYDTIIEHRAGEKKHLQYMLFVAANFQGEQRLRLLKVANAAYNQTDAATTTMEEQAAKDYPPRQASSR